MDNTENCMSPGVGVTHRLVVPSAFVELLLAEQTTATLCSTRLGLDRKANVN